MIPAVSWRIKGRRFPDVSERRHVLLQLHLLIAWQSAKAVCTYKTNKVAPP